ncbi:hypothetical protein EPN44_09430 [bacterium]|nr:MAG: hypothetical protein EPN44_09430 [bacterium]
MSRIGRFWLTVSGIIAALAMVSQLVLAGPQAPGTGGTRRLPEPPTPPPLPLRVAPTATPAAATAAAGRHIVRITSRAGLRRPAPMTVGRALASMAGHRRIASASGGTIVLTGDSTIYQIYDATLSYNNFNYIQCAGLQPSTNYTYLIFPPDGTSFTGSAGPTDNNGNCWGYFPLYFGTPYDSTPNPGTAAPYSGVWTFVAQNNNTGNYDSVVYVVVLASQHFDTYADGALLHPATDFTAGSTVYASASGLNPAHSYAFGWVYTGAANLPCVYSVPASSNSQPGTCFVAGSTVGSPVPTGQMTVGWPVGATPRTGTYTVQLYDATTSDLVGTQQVSIEPSTIAWTLTPYNATLGTGTNLGDIFANDGFIDASVTGLTYRVTGLPAGSNGHTIGLTVSDPNGMVLNNGASAGVPSGTLPTATQGAGSATFTQNPFPANASTLEALGPTVTPLAPNVLTAQLYDRNSGTVLGTKSFTILGYQGAFAWTNPLTNVLATAVPGTTAQVTVSNAAGGAFGPWNADGISGVRLSNDGQGEQLSLPGGNTTATDSAGSLWDIVYVGGASTAISATPDPANPTATLSGATTLAFNIQVSLTSGNVCKTGPCNIQSGILPQHGIAYSASDSVTNPLLVLQQGGAFSGVATEAWRVTNGPAPINLPRFNQAMYDVNTGGTPSNAAYSLTLTVVNKGPNETLKDLEMTFPSTYDGNTNTPILQSVTVNGANQTGWRVLPQQSNGALTTNQIELQCRGGCAGVGFNKTAVFVLNFPMFQIPFGYQSIPMVANFDNPSGGGAPYTLSSTQSTQNAIVGATNIDSTELAVYSLNPTTMTSVFSPNTVPTGLASTTVLNFTNTSNASSPFPDYVDEIDLSVPSGVIPTSIAVPAGWYVNQTASGPPATYVIQVCPIGQPKPCSSAYEANALAPGQTLPITFNYAASPFPTTGTYNVAWTVVGANGGATSAPSQNATLTVSPTSASVAFTDVGGYVGAFPPSGNPTPVPGSTQPQIGTDANNPNGSSFLYQIANNGQKTITSVNITVPGQTRAFINATDGAGVFWKFAVAPYVNGPGAASPGTCSGSLNASNYGSATAGGGNGVINLTGCNIASGQSINLYFNAETPYDLGSYFDWPTRVTSTGAGGGTVNATPPYAGAGSLQVVFDAQMNIITPPSGTGTVLPKPGPGGSMPATNCLGCVVDTTQSPTLITLGSFTGTFTATDLVNASISSDAVSPDSWTLYASANNNPLNGSSKPELQVAGDAATSSSASGFSIAQAAFAALPVIASPSGSNPGLAISTYNGQAYHKPVDTIMSFLVDSTGSTSPGSTIVTFTLVLN